jgi:hypothetical protein
MNRTLYSVTTAEGMKVFDAMGDAIKVYLDSGTKLSEEVYSLVSTQVLHERQVTVIPTFLVKPIVTPVTILRKEGTVNPPAEKKRRMLTAELVHQACKMLASGKWTQTEVSNELDIAANTILKIAHKTTHPQIVRQYDFRNMKKGTRGKRKA